MLLAGQFVDRENRIEVRNPYDNSVVDAVPAGSVDDVKLALDAAYSAKLQMRKLPLIRRAAILAGTAGIIESRKEEFALTIASEVGKTIREARAEVGRAIETFTLAAEDSKRIRGGTVPFTAASNGAGKTGYYVREPVGVVAAITPFNFPLNLAAHKVAPAIAAGNPVVLKPATATPIADLMMGEALLEAGMVPEALSIITGSGSVIGNALIEDERVRLVSFTGSARVGKEIMAKAGLKYSIMELGSNSPVIVMPDADMRLAVDKVSRGAYAVAGQVCISVQRLIVGESIYSEFIDRLASAVSTLEVGNQLCESTDMGPLIDESAAAHGEGLARDAVACGARAVLPIRREGALMYPTILADVTSGMRAFREEAFAPLVTVTTFKTLDEAIRLANDSRFGLQAGVFTNDVNVALRAAEDIETGGVMINEVPTFRVDLMPYGGVKDSGLGREGLTHAIEAMTEIKLVCFNRIC